jgi:hypothetical protein
MNPEQVTVGARLGRRLRPIIVLGLQKSSDPTSFAGGLLSTVIGQVAGLLGAGTAAELIRINLERLEQKGARLLLPPGVREAFDTAANDEPPAPVAEALASVFDEQLEAMRRVLAVVSAKAGIESDKLVELLDAAIAEIRAGVPPRPPA